MTAPRGLRWLLLVALLGAVPPGGAEPADPTLAILQRADSFLHRAEVDGVARDSRNLRNPPEEIRLSVVPQLLGYCELYRIFPHTTAYRDIAERADFLLAHREEATAGSAFDGMLALAFLEAHAVTGDPRYRAAAEPYLTTFRLMSGPDLRLNWGLMAAMALAEDARATGNVASLNMVHAILAGVAREQNSDGSFPHFCFGSRDVHYSAWMAMELILISRRVDDPLLDPILTRVSGFLGGRVSRAGATSYETLGPLGARAVFYSRGFGCNDYDTRGWTNELGYSALVFDHLRDPRAHGVLDRLRQLQDGGAFSDKWGYPAGDLDPIQPWASSPRSVIRTSVIFWSLASLYASRGSHVPVRYEGPVESPSSDEVASGAPLGESGQSSARDEANGDEDLAPCVAHEAPAAILPLASASRAVGAISEGVLLQDFALGPAHPNPSAAGCEFVLRLPRAAEVRLRVFDSAGRLVRDLSPGSIPVGLRTLRWDGRDDGGRRAAAGLYWIEARAGEWSGRTRVVLAR